MRHAKSSWADGGLSDFERPLNKRGLRVMPQMAEFVHLQGLTPDVIVSSSAVRAKMTAELFVEHCKDVTEDQLRFTKSFYHAPAETYIEYTERFSEESSTILMFVGHNPGMEDLVEKVSGLWETMPTAAVAHFDLGVEKWSEAGGLKEATLKNLWRPKEIGIK